MLALIFPGDRISVVSASIAEVLLPTGQRIKAEDAPDGANILCMLADTAERYLSSVLFEEIDSEMNDEENDLLNSI